MTEHLSEMTAAAYVDGRLTVEQRRAAEEHLAECAICREEVVETARLTRPKSRSMRTAIPLAAAAIIAIVMLGVNKTQAPNTPVMRGAENAAVIQTTTPLDNARVVGAASLTWRRSPEAGEYRVTLTTANGDVVAEKVTTDTVAVFSDLAPHASFRWYVTAILQNGSARSSGVRSFQTQ